jgi:anthranilate synthase component 1
MNRPYEIEKMGDLQNILNLENAKKQLKVKEITTRFSPPELFLEVQERFDYAYLLESMVGPEKLAQFSFIGFEPRDIVTGKNGLVKINRWDLDEEIIIKTDDPIDVLEEIVINENHHQNFRFIGGALGYISYDAVRYWERLPEIAVDDLKLPDIEMGIFEDGFIFDHVQGKTFYYHRGQDNSNLLDELETSESNFGSLSHTSLKSNVTQEKHEKSVERAKDYIASGDIFQVVLSKRYDFRIDGELTKFYIALRNINPSPYMYFLKMGKRRIIGSSPEMLVRVDNRRVETYPIAGTIQRVEDPAENEALANELFNDPKERAEHVMLVDLGRNDIGKVARFGSVHVPEFIEVHEYSHVHHLVSRVVGEMRDECDSFDAMRAVFPAGTLTGAPKIRAMEIIEESEPTRRGPYGGAVGYFSYNGNADFAITIRTLVAENNRCSIQAGGGIVADSIPEKEWFETEHKARALLKALEHTEV